jgi:hypothetical protein
VNELLRLKLPATPLNGLSVMLAECFGIVNLKNKLSSRKKTYDENDYFSFHMSAGRYDAIAGIPTRVICDAYATNGSWTCCRAINPSQADVIKM